MQPLLLDLYCSAGGAAMGYHRAGFRVVGVDIKQQPHYPFEFVQSDALEYLEANWRRFDAFHASPPCQRYSGIAKYKGVHMDYPDLIAPTRERIETTGRLYNIENVPGAPLRHPVMLCGSMFGLRVQRHRLFEMNFMMLAPSCNHAAQLEVVGVYGHSGGSSRRDDKKFHGVNDWRDAMGIDWMTGDELAEAIPPAYTEFIGRYMMQVLTAGAGL